MIFLWTFTFVYILCLCLFCIVEFRNAKASVISASELVLFFLLFLTSHRHHLSVFLRCSAMHKHVLLCHGAAAGCLSVMFVYCMETDKDILKVLSPFSSSTVLVLCLCQTVDSRGYYVSLCPMSASAFLSLHTNTEQILMRFGGESLPATLHFGRNCTMDKGAGYDRKFESTSNWCCHIANDFTNYTVHTACCIRRAGESITRVFRSHWKVMESHEN